MLTYRGAVYPWQCDHIGHMNVMWYVGKFDEATWCFFSSLGLTSFYFTRMRRGMAAVDQHVSYLQELHPGDTVSIHTQLLESSGKSIRFLHEMRKSNEEKIVARTTLKSVHMDIDRRKSCEFAHTILAGIESFKSHLPEG